MTDRDKPTGTAGASGGGSLPATRGEASSGAGPMTDAMAEGAGPSMQGAGSAGNARGEGGRHLDDASQQSIERHLRTMFDEVAAEPVPERFVNLLNELERSESRGSRPEKR